MKNKVYIVGHSLSTQGDELITVLATYPRIIHAEMLTHRMFSRNASSSRAVPVQKMIEAVKNNTFCPFEFQKAHKGMQGSEYFTDEDKEDCIKLWLESAELALQQAEKMKEKGITKQIINRILEPYQYYTVLITGSREGWQNFFELRCGNYDGFKSRKEASKEFLEKGNINTSTWSELDWLHLNKGQAEIHIIDLAEKIYDAVNESTPKQLQAGEWHIPMISDSESLKLSTNDQIKLSVGRAANTSYTVVGDGKELTLEHAIKIHDKCVELVHSSVFEHCARAMSDEEYECFLKGEREINKNANHWSDVEYFYDYDKIFGWCNNLKGFIPYRYMIDNNLI